MKIGVFTEFFESEKNSAGKVMSELADELSNHAELVDVYTLYKRPDSSFLNKKNINIYTLNYDFRKENISFINRFIFELLISFRIFFLIFKVKKT